MDLWRFSKDAMPLCLALTASYSLFYVLLPIAGIGTPYIIGEIAGWALLSAYGFMTAKSKGYAEVMAVAAISSVIAFAVYLSLAMGILVGFAGMGGLATLEVLAGAALLPDADGALLGLIWISALVSAMAFLVVKGIVFSGLGIMVWKQTASHP